MDKSKLIEIYMICFESLYRISKVKDPGFVVDDSFIEAFFKTVPVQYKDCIEEGDLSEEDKKIIINKIKATHLVHQDEGFGLVESYEHDFDWYEKLQEQGLDEFYWNRYEKYLEGRNFNQASLEVLGNRTLPKIMSYVGNPNDVGSFSIRGLVVGDVQSGKTSNYIGLMAKAADAGYKVMILLTGTVESLRRQTQIRMEEGFIGYDSVNRDRVGVGLDGKKIPRAFTSRENDFTGKNDQNSGNYINDDPDELPMVFVIKKNVTVLRKVYTYLKKGNTDFGRDKIKAPLLLIDDEADNASINTGKKEDDPTQVNALIRKILVLFERNTYIGYTATPFANVFINYDSETDMLSNDLFPKHFIYSLDSPSNYVGPKKYFSDSEPNSDGAYVKFIDDYDERMFPLRHDSGWNGDTLFPSFYHAINVFLIANAIRDIREPEKNTHRTMLINMSRFTAVHFRIRDIVDDYLKEVRRAVKQNCKYDRDTYLKNDTIKSLYASYTREYKNNGNSIYDKSVSWDEIFEALSDSVRDVHTAVVNSSKGSTKIDYEETNKITKTGLRVIAIGGLALSRGLTLEGLCVSYFYRNTATYDVLMQMGRWFGYRDEYDDLCRVYLSKSSCEYYKEISEAIEDLKADIRIMGEQGKTPKEYGIRVRNDSTELAVTAPNKSRYTRMRKDRQWFYGSIIETPYLHRNLDIMKHNLDRTESFVCDVLSKATHDESVGHPYFRGVSGNDVVAFLRGLNIHEANLSFSTHQICEFISKKDMLFDVLLMGGEKSNDVFMFPTGVSDNCVRRDFDIVNKVDKSNQIIRMNRQRRRLGGSHDTAYGLGRSDISMLENSLSKKEKSLNNADFLIEGRNPLLIIYFIQPGSEKKKDTGSLADEKSLDENVMNEQRLLSDMVAHGIPYLVGYSLAFPKKEGAEAMQDDTYVVNSTCDYFSRMDQEDLEMYGEIEK